MNQKEIKFSILELEREFGKFWRTCYHENNDRVYSIPSFLRYLSDKYENNPEFSVIGNKYENPKLLK